MAYLLLFATAFLAGSLFPAQSEAVFIALLAQQNYSNLLLLFSASLGNILGSCLNWYLGIKIQHFQHKKWFPFSPQHIAKAEKCYHKYGYFSLLFSWLPIIGDPLTLIAGIFREHFLRFIILVSIAKFGRYLALYSLYIYWNY